LNKNEKVFLVFLFNIRVLGTGDTPVVLGFDPQALGTGSIDRGTSIDLELDDLPDGCVMGSSYIITDSKAAGADKNLQLAVVAMFRSGNQKWEITNPKVTVDNLLLTLNQRLSYWNPPPIRISVVEMLMDESEGYEWLNAVLPTQVKIGVIFPGGWHWGEQIICFAEEDINRYCVSEDLHYEFEFITTNAHDSVEQHLEEVQMFDGNGLNLLIGGYQTNQAQGSQEYINHEDNNMLLISPSSTGDALATAGDNLFRLSPTNLNEARVIAQMVATHEQGFEAAVLLRIDDPWSEDLAAAIETELGVLFASTIVYDREDPENISASLGAAEAEVNGAGNAALIFLGFEEVVDIVRTVDEEPELYDDLRNTLWFCSSTTVFENRLIWEVPEIAEHLKMYGPMPRPDQHKLEELFERYKYETGHELDLPLSYYIANEYDACWLLAKAIIDAETMDTTAVKDALRIIASNYDGVSGPVSLDENDDRHEVDYDIWGCGYPNGDVAWIIYGEYIADSDEVHWYE
jgi:branched-chain amino acid transport system substrate-binding protein